MVLSVKYSARPRVGDGPEPHDQTRGALAKRLNREPADRGSRAAHWRGRAVNDIRKRAGRGLWRAVYASLVDHEDFRALSPNARLVLFVLRLGPSTTIASIFIYYREVLQAQTGLASRALEEALKELERTPSAERPWIVRDASVIWIRNGLRFDPNLSVGNDNHIVAVRRTVAALPQRSAVVQQFLAYYPLVGPMDDAMGASYRVREGASHGGSRSSSSTPNRTPEQNSEPAGDGSPAPPRFLSLLGKSQINGHPTCGDYQDSLERLRRKHPELAEAEAQEQALRAPAT